VSDERQIAALREEVRRAGRQVTVVRRGLYAAVVVAILVRLTAIIFPPLREWNRQRVYGETVARIRREFPNGKP
jgi:hypothetical protein